MKYFWRTYRSHKIFEGSWGGGKLFYLKYVCQYYDTTTWFGSAAKILCMFKGGLQIMSTRSSGSWIFFTITKHFNQPSPHRPLPHGCNLRKLPSALGTRALDLYPRWGGTSPKYFGSQVQLDRASSCRSTSCSQQTNKKSTKSTLRFCENEGSKRSKSNKKWGQLYWKSRWKFI